MKLISSILYDYQILPYFIRHYQEQGVNKFFFFVYDIKFDLEIENCFFIKSSIEENSFCAELDSEVRNFMRRIFVKKNEWYVIADLDEFSTIENMTLKETTLKCEEKKCDVILGNFYDRITLDGSIPQKLSNNLWEQFPVIAPVTERIRKAPTHKLVAAKGNIASDWGHHTPLGNFIAYPTRARVNHFSWWGDPVGRLKKRCESRANRDTKKTYKNVIEHIEKNNKIFISNNKYFA